MVDNLNTKKNRKKIDKQFNEQEKEFNFRFKEIKDYREKAQQSLKLPLQDRFNKTSKKDLESIKITKDRLSKRQNAYGVPHISIELRKIEKGKNKGKLEYVARNTKSKKIEARVFEKEALTRKEHERILRDEIGKKGFNYDKFYIPEDSEPLRKEDKDPLVTVSYNTFFRYGIIIYRLKKGKRYEVVFRANESRVIDRYVSFQRIIAQVKGDILNATGITLEEWIYLSKTQNNLFVEGGLSYKRKKGIHHPDRRFKFVTDYEQIIDFESI